MNAPFDAEALNSLKFGIGQPVPRQEDPTLLRGQGRYTDDLNLPDQAHCVMVRSQVAHGTINAIDIEEARAMPGVLGVWTGADLDAAGYGPLKTMIPVPNVAGGAPAALAIPEDAERLLFRHGSTILTNPTAERRIKVNRTFTVQADVQGCAHA